MRDTQPFSFPSTSIASRPHASFYKHASQGPSNVNTVLHWTTLWWIGSTAFIHSKTTMAPVIRSRYEQYKRDTQQFTTWLAQTAISLDYPLSNFDEEAQKAGDEEVEKVEENGNAAEVIIKSDKSKKNAKRKARAKDKVKLARESVVEKQGNGPSGAPSGKHMNQPKVPTERLISRRFQGSGHCTTS
jgi:hypothetical protein